MALRNYIVFLNEILKIKGITQTRLAKELGVTHATLNRWLHEKTNPHPKKIDQIELLFQKYFFYTRLEPVAAVKQLQKRFSQLKKNAIGLDSLLQYQDVFDDYLLKLTYHSNKIEGSTLSLRETQSILFDNQVIANHSLIEHLEVTNHRLAFQKIIQSVQNQTLITLEFVLTLHQILMRGIHEESGQFRNHPVRIVGSRVVPCNYVKVPEKMANLCKQMELTEDPIGMVMQHAWFEEIHPFADGNGRMGRLLLNYQLLRAGHPLIIIESGKKHIYYDVLEQAQVKQIYQPLLEFALDEMEEPLISSSP